MSSLIHRSLLWLGCMALCACTSLPIQPPPVEPANYQAHLQSLGGIRSFALTGRIGVLTEKKGFSGLMRWYHNAEGDEITLYSPLGTQLGQISASAQGVTLVTSDQKQYFADDAETLTQDTLGWSLPLSGLPDWVLGRPTAGAAEILAWDEAGRIARLRQGGWDIEYPVYKESGDLQLPGKVVLKSPRLDLKLIVEDWQADTEQDAE